MPATVMDFLAPRPKTVLGDAPAAEAAVLLARENVRDVLVVDRDGRLIGVIDEPPADGLTAAEAARPVDRTLAAETAAVAALTLMEELDLLRLPVVAADGHLVGVIARKLLARELRGT